MYNITKWLRMYDDGVSIRQSLSDGDGWEIKFKTDL